MDSMVLSQRVPPFHRDKIHILHTFLRLLRRDWADLQKKLGEKQFQSPQSRRNCASTIFHHLCFYSSGQWTRGSEDWVSAFCECQHHFLSDFVPFSLWAVFTDRIPVLLWSRPEEWSLSCSESLCIERETSWEFDSHSFLLSFDPHEMSLNIDMKMTRPINFSGVTLNLNSNSSTLWLSCNVVNPGKISHSNSIGSPSILSKSSVLWWTFEPRQSVFPCNIWLRVLVHLSKTQHRIWEYVDFCALGADDFFITNQRQILPWRVFPKNCFHSIDLVWQLGHQLFRYVEHLFHCEIFCIFDGMPIVWVILLHEYRCSQCWGHKHSPYYRMFVAVCYRIFEDCFCLFRTWSFTLCKNDLYPNDNSDSASVQEFVSSFSITNWSACCEQITGLFVLSSTNSSDFHSWEDQILPIFHSD